MAAEITVTNGVASGTHAWAGGEGLIKVSSENWNAPPAVLRPQHKDADDAAWTDFHDGDGRVIQFSRNGGFRFKLDASATIRVVVLRGSINANVHIVAPE